MPSNITLETEARLPSDSAPYHSNRAVGTNVSMFERILSTAAGGLLVIRGAQKRSIASLTGAVVGAELIRRGISGECRLYRAANINTAISGKYGEEIAMEAPEIRRSITIKGAVDQVYSLWRDPANMARVLSPFAEVSAASEGVTHWRVRSPLGDAWEWDGREREEESDGRRKIIWQSLPGGRLANRGEVVFRPGPDGTGTEVHLWVQFEPPLGSFGAALSKKFHKVPRSIAGQILRRFKSLVETGEIPTLEHNPSARGDSDAF